MAKKLRPCRLHDIQQGLRKVGMLCLELLQQVLLAAAHNNLVVNISHIHHEVDVIAEVVAHNAPDDVLCNIVSCVSHMTCIIHGGTTIVPRHKTSTLRHKKLLGPRQTVVHVQLRCWLLRLRHLPHAIF